MKIKLLAVIILSFFCNPYLSFGQDAPVIQNQRELFIDNYLIEKLDNIDARLGTPVSGGVALKFDKPWEGKFSAYVSVINDGFRYRMYYRGLVGHENKGDRQVTCYAESIDGIHWIKPNLRLFEVDGTFDNNVILLDNPQMSTHNFTVMYDDREKIPDQEKFKAVGGHSNQGNPLSGLFRYVSADGIHWNRFEKDTTSLFHDFALDSQNVLTWIPSENYYAVYMRGWTGGTPGELYPKGGVRSIVRSISKDFINWTQPELMKFGDTEPEHLYTNATHPYFRAPHILISMPFRFSPSVKVLSDEEMKENGTDPTQWKGVADGVFMSSRGGNVYDRKFLESFVRPGLEQKNWSARSNIPALGVISTGANEMSFFVTRAYGTKDVYLERMKLRKDGFASLHAGYAEGSAVTKPIILKGSELLLNYSTSSIGYVKVVLLDEAGKELLGFSEADAEKIVGDKIDEEVTWNSGKTINDLGNKKVRIKFIAKDANIYSFGMFN